MNMLTVQNINQYYGGSHILRVSIGCRMLAEAAGQAFYNTSRFTLRDL